MKRFLHIITLLLAGIAASAYDGGIDDAEIHIATDSVAAVGDSLLPKPAVRKKNPLLRLLDKALDVDTNYIERNKFNVTLMAQSDWRFKQIRLSGTDDEGRTQSLYFHPHSQVTIGPYVGYSLLFLGWTVDIGSHLTTNNSNLYLSLYAPMFGIDYYHENDVDGYRIQRIDGFDREVMEDGKNLPFPGLSTNMKYVHVYYIFNHRHFSYPAAYSQSTVQRRSSGALILGYNYSRQIINFNYNLLPEPFFDTDGNLILNDALQVKQVRYTNHSVSLGYTYNWVFARNFLFNVSASPAIGYNFTRGENLTHDKIYRLRNLNFDFIGKLGFVWNSQRLFAGWAFTAHTYTYKKSTFSCLNLLLSGQIYAGINIWRKKNKEKK